MLYTCAAGSKNLLSSYQPAQHLSTLDGHVSSSWSTGRARRREREIFPLRTRSIRKGGTRFIYQDATCSCKGVVSKSNCDQEPHAAVRHEQANPSQQHPTSPKRARVARSFRCVGGKIMWKPTPHRIGIELLRTITAGGTPVTH